MSWTCPHWVDLTVAWVAGVCVGLTVGVIVGIGVSRMVEWYRVQGHSQFPNEEAE